ncbi:MAG TPA: hypothetical protein VD999_01070 [Vitreimonas sp.]|nr:hypothetical protein [Vitreimonas sp.]
MNKRKMVGKMIILAVVIVGVGSGLYQSWYNHQPWWWKAGLQHNETTILSGTGYKVQLSHYGYENQSYQNSELRLLYPDGSEWIALAGKDYLFGEQIVNDKIFIASRGQQIDDVWWVEIDPYFKTIVEHKDPNYIPH